MQACVKLYFIMTKHLQRVQIVVKNDDMWKELQQELAKSGAISGAAIQDITRKFLQRKESEIDSQIEAQSLQTSSRSISPRRNSNDLEYSRRSSLSYISEKSRHIRRAFSLQAGEETCKSSTRSARLNDIVHQTLNRINDTMSTLGLEIPNKVSSDYRLEVVQTSMDQDTIHDWEHQHSMTGEISEVDELTSTSTANLSKDWSLHLSKLTLDSPMDFDDDDISCNGCSNGDLLVDFPTQSRRHSNEMIENGSNSTARTA
jgi:hypothetical protein